MKESNSKEEIVFDIGAFLIKIQEDLQGYVLDLVRMSSLGDRQFGQFEKSTKKYFRSTIDESIKILKEYKNFQISERPQLVPKEEIKK